MKRLVIILATVLTLSLSGCGSVTSTIAGFSGSTAEQEKAAQLQEEYDNMNLISKGLDAAKGVGCDILKSVPIVGLFTPNSSDVTKVGQLSKQKSLALEEQKQNAQGAALSKAVTSPSFIIPAIIVLAVIILLIILFLKRKKPQPQVYVEPTNYRTGGMHF